jgi:heme/copper-type cytochrome/quinol oxidase subunit 3
MTQMEQILRNTTKNNSMSIKQITDNLFGLEAMIGWLSSGFLIIVNLAINSNAIDGVTAWAGAAFAISTGFFAMMKMFESWKEARAKRRMAEKELEEDNVHGAGGNA